MLRHGLIALIMTSPCLLRDFLPAQQWQASATGELKARLQCLGINASAALVCSMLNSIVSLIDSGPCKTDQRGA